LFVLMAELTSNDVRPSDKEQVMPIGPVILQLEEPTTIVNQKIKPPPEAVSPPQRMKPEVPDAQPPSAMGKPTYTYSGPKIKIADKFSFGNDNDTARPIVQVEPNYPPDAARDGTQGWVKLRFTINEVGGVTDINVIDANPKRTFDREAKRALAKWKYQPKRVEGKAVSQPDMQVLLEFKLAE